MNARNFADCLEKELELIDLCLGHLSEFDGVALAAVDLRRTDLILERFRSRANLYLSQLQLELLALDRCFATESESAKDETERPSRFTI